MGLKEQVTECWKLYQKKYQFLILHYLIDPLGKAGLLKSGNTFAKKER